MTAILARMALLAITLLLLAPTTSAAQAPVTSVSSLGAARVSPLPGGVVVVSMDANGDLPGLLTLTLHVSGRVVTGGEWALVLSSRQPGVVGNAPVVRGREVPDSEGPSDQVGTLAGVVEPGGTLTVAADGTVVGVTAVALTIAHVTPASPGVIGGYGRAEAGDLNDYTRSHGHLTLVF
jgi:hypothetical protein